MKPTMPGIARRHAFTTWAIALLSLSSAAAARGQARAIDTAKSVLTVRVYKSGMLSAFGHDHEVSGPVARGMVDVTGHKVELRAAAAALRVRDPKASDKERGEIQATMLGPEVLDAEKYKEIVFQSTSVEPAGAGAWKVTGNLTLHGETRPVSLEVRETGGSYAGTCRFRITDFGIKPVKAAGGTVSVKDEVRVEFNIRLAP
jgi:polyisoprenoid-binding protein YceI